MKTRCAGIVKFGEGIALMHRRNVKKQENSTKPYGEYYVFPGGGLEDDDASVEDGVKREIREEFGIEVDVIRKQYENIIPGELAEYIYLCEYVSGEFGTGSGPEFSNDPAYADRGEYLPEIVDKNKIKDLPLIPQNLKEKIVKDIEEGKI